MTNSIEQIVGDCAKAPAVPTANTSGYNARVLKERDTWGTPPDFWSVINRIWEPALDVCATAENTKCRMWLTPEINGLTADWLRDGSVNWCNPGYSDVSAWLAKAESEAVAGATSLVLTHVTLAARVARFFKTVDTVFMIVNPRINFLLPKGLDDGVRRSVNNRDNMMWLFTPWAVADTTGSGYARTIYWNWKQHTKGLDNLPLTVL